MEKNRVLIPSAAGGSDGEVSLDGRRYFYDKRLNAIVVWVAQGEFYVTRRPYEVISTVLGSCVAVCMRDPITGYGGMNHFLLPFARREPTSAMTPDKMLRYGSYSIERLTNALVARGACRDAIEVKVFGGANVLRTGSNLGHQNADFVESYLKRERLRVVASSLRGDCPRRVRYFPSTGKAFISEQVATAASLSAIARQEAQAAQRVKATAVEGTVVMFQAAPARKAPQ